MALFFQYGVTIPGDDGNSDEEIFLISADTLYDDVESEDENGSSAGLIVSNAIVRRAEADSLKSEFKRALRKLDAESVANCIERGYLVRDVDRRRFQGYVFHSSIAVQWEQLMFCLKGEVFQGMDHVVKYRRRCSLIKALFNASEIVQESFE